MPDPRARQAQGGSASTARFAAAEPAAGTSEAPAASTEVLQSAVPLEPPVAVGSAQASSSSSSSSSSDDDSSGSDAEQAEAAQSATHADASALSEVEQQFWGGVIAGPGSSAPGRHSEHGAAGDRLASTSRWGSSGVRPGTTQVEYI